MNIIKLVVSIVSIQAILSASTFEWSSTTQSKSVDKPSMYITALIEKEMNERIYSKKPLDISHAIPKEIVLPIMPPEVKKPYFPTSLELKRGQFEKSDAFDKRVLTSTKEREKELKVLQENYRLQVQVRNETIEKLSKKYNEDVAKRNAILTRIKEIHDKDLSELEVHYSLMKKSVFDNIEQYSKHAVDEVYGQAKVHFNSYDADREMMYLTLSSFDGKNFQKEIEVNIAPKQAQKIKDKIEEITPKVVFNVEVDDDKQLSYSIQKISFVDTKKEYVANDISSVYTFEPSLVTIENTSSLSKLNEVALAPQSTSTEFQLQNPNLNSKFSLGAVAMNSSGVIMGNNYLVNQIKGIKKREIDKSKWIFMVAVEDYAETDDVIFAKRSAVALKKVMQTRFGIDERHTYALIDEKATSGAIKDKLRAMLQNVKEEDTIYFYYSGHGIPAKSGDAYILPQDKIVDFIDKDPFFKLENIYAMLSESKAKHSFAFIDSCFSGKTDDVLVFKGVAPGLIQSKKAAYDETKMTIITAGLNDEFSNMYKSKRYRLFSYYLTEALIDNISDVELLYKKVNYKVAQQSNEMGDRYTQNPQIYGSDRVKLY